MTDLTKPARLFHAPFTCSLAVRLAAALGDVELDIAPVRLGKCETKFETAHHAANPLGQVSTLILPDKTILTETSACLMWVQSQSSEEAFKRSPESPEYYQILRWIGFCATELHKQILRIIFYNEASDAVKDNFRRLALSRLDHVNSHLSGRDVLVGDTLSAADSYVFWFLTLCENAGVSLSPYQNITAYYENHQSDSVFAGLYAEDKILKQSLSL